MSVKSATESLTEYIHNTYHTSSASTSTSIADGHGIDEQLAELKNQFQDGIKHLQQTSGSISMQPSVSMPQLPTFQNIKLKPVTSDVTHSININHHNNENPRRKLPRPMTASNLLSATPTKIKTDAFTYDQYTMPIVVSSALSSSSSSNSNSSSSSSHSSSPACALLNSPKLNSAYVSAADAIATATSNQDHDHDATHISSKLDLLINILHSQQNLLTHLVSFKKQRSSSPSPLPKKKKKKCKHNKKQKTEQKAIQTCRYVDKSVQTVRELRCVIQQNDHACECKQETQSVKFPPIPDSSSHALDANSNITLPYSTLIKLVTDLQTLNKTNSQFVYPIAQARPHVHPYIVPQHQPSMMTPRSQLLVPDRNVNQSPKSTLYFSDHDD